MNTHTHTHTHTHACMLCEKLLDLTFIGLCILMYFYSKTNKMHQFYKFILFWNNTLHVSDGLSAHHQESKTVHTASGICQTDSADCLLAVTRWNSRLRPYIQHQVYVKLILLTAC